MQLTAFFSRVVGFIRSDPRRFITEIVIVVLTTAISYGIGWILDSKDLKACQDERTALLRISAQHQSLKDSVHYNGIISKKDQTISQKDEQIYDLRRQRASDSIQLQTALQSVRALNAYIDSGKRLPK